MKFLSLSFSYLKRSPLLALSVSYLIWTSNEWRSRSFFWTYLYLNQQKELLKFILIQTVNESFNLCGLEKTDQFEMVTHEVLRLSWQAGNHWSINYDKSRYFLISYGSPGSMLFHNTDRLGSLDTCRLVLKDFPFESKLISKKKLNISE